MTYIHGFAPIAKDNAQTLILGSMPGKASLLNNQYYAHPRNSLWKILASLLGFDLGLPYEKRCQKLLEHNIALWDVLKTCTRSSSLDSDIISSSIITNNFSDFFETNNKVSRVFFNGKTAQKIYIKHILPNLKFRFSQLPLQALPSTSPAHASLNFEEKLQAWSILTEH